MILLMDFFHFEKLGLRSNPFRALTDKEWADIAVLPASVTKALERSGQQIQILGAMGRGKSTLLRGLTAQLQERAEKVVYEYIPLGKRCFLTQIRGLTTFVLDEAQRLWFWEKRRLFGMSRRWNTRVIISSHEDLTHHFNHYQLAVTTIILDSTDADYVETILSKRLAYFALKEPSPLQFTPEAIAYLLKCFGSNLRSMEYFLYEVFQRLDKIEPIGVQQLEMTRTDLLVTE